MILGLVSRSETIKLQPIVLQPNNFGHGAVEANPYCSSLQPHDKIMAESCIGQLHPLHIVPEGSAPDFPGGSDCPERHSAKIRCKERQLWHGTVRLRH